MKIGLLAVSLCALSLYAEDEPCAPASPARAAFTTTSAMTGTGNLNLEWGPHFTENRNGSNQFFAPTQVLLGLGERFDVRMYWNGPVRMKASDDETATGPSDPWVGFQWFLAPQDEVGIDIAMGYWHKLPRASVLKGIGTGQPDDQLLLILTHTQGPWVVDLNVLHNWLGRPGGHGHVKQPAMSLAVTRRLSKRWHLTGECYALSQGELSKRVVSTLWSFSFEATPKLMLDAGVDIGLSHGAQKGCIFAGLAYSFGPVFGKH